MSATAEGFDPPAARIAARRRARLRHWDLVGLVFTLITLALAILWAFPLIWSLVTTFKPEYEVVRPGVQLWPEHFTFEAYIHVLTGTKIGFWYMNSLITSVAVTVIVVIMAAGAGYAISQLSFPGRRFLWWMILASFIVPIAHGLVVNHFNPDEPVPHLINTAVRRRPSPACSPVTVMIYKQFFDFGAEGFSRGGCRRRRQ